MYDTLYEDEFMKVILTKGCWDPPAVFYIKMRDIDDNQYLVKGNIDFEIAKSFLALIERRHNE